MIFGWIVKNVADIDGYYRVQVEARVSSLRSDISAPKLLERAEREGDRRVLRFLGAEDEVALAGEEEAWGGMIEAEQLQRRGRGRAAL